MFAYTDCLYAISSSDRRRRTRLHLKYFKYEGKHQEPCLAERNSMLTAISVNSTIRIKKLLTMIDGGPHRPSQKQFYVGPLQTKT